ncbi:hypothetical protein AZG88_45155 [Rhodococcus sp. LB1]|nr:hypothetical protein AZG88_45155 [Rhodococcus sp. LB1]
MLTKLSFDTSQYLEGECAADAAAVEGKKPLWTGHGLPSFVAAGRRIDDSDAGVRSGIPESVDKITCATAAISVLAIPHQKRVWPRIEHTCPFNDPNVGCGVNVVALWNPAEVDNFDISACQKRPEPLLPLGVRNRDGVLLKFSRR